MLSLCIHLVVLIVIAWKPAGAIYTSTAKIDRLVKQENVLLERVKHYIDIKRKELQDLENFHSERLQAYYDNHDVIKEFHADHPNAQHNTLKEFLHRYTNRLSNIQTSDQNSEEPLANDTHSTVYLPTNGDLSGARRSLFNIQTVYNLNPSDMVKGNYSGFQGPPLHYEDAFQIGRDAFTEGTFSRSVEWLKAAIEAYDARKENGQLFASYTLTTSLNIIEIKALLGRAYLSNGDKENALEIYADIREIRDLDADVPDLIEFENELDSYEDFASTSQTVQTEDSETSTHICSLEQPTNTFNVNDPRLVCRHQSGFVPYYRFKEELLSVSPFVSVFYNFTTDKEAREIMESSAPFLDRALVANYDGSSGETDERTGELAWISENNMETAALLTNRIEQVTKLNTMYRKGEKDIYKSEPLQVVNYGIGGLFTAHMDSMEIENNKMSRLVTFLMYLTDVPKGGATFFFKLNISVPPTKNMALFWYNYIPSMKLDYRTIHEGCPVVIGQKWIVTKWISRIGNEFSRRCGLSQNDTQLDIEPLMNHKWLKLSQ